MFGNRPLQEEYAELESLYQTAPVGLALLDREMRYVRVNDRLAAINGRPAQDHIGRTLREIVPDVAPVLEPVFRDVIATGRAVLDLEVRGSTSADPGVPHVWTASYYPLRGAGGRVSGVSVVVQDVTTRRDAEELLRQGHDRLQTILDSMFVFVAVLSTDGRILHVNRAPLEAAGLTEQDVIGAEVGQIYSVAYSPAVRDRMRAAVRRAAAGEAVRYDERLLMQRASIWIDVMFSPLRDADGRVHQILASATDITERRKAESAVLTAHQRLQRVSRRLLDVQETERRCLARELHDEVGQALTAASLNLQVLAQAPQTPAADARLRDTSAIVERLIAQVRSLSLTLRPSLLDDFGLTPALRWLLDQQAPRAGLAAALTGDDVPRLDAPVEIACFRIAQEALSNVVRHAAAREVAIDVRHDGATLRLRVRDDGRGFDWEAARARAAAGESLGLLGIEERAALAGGRVTWRSGAGAGTEIDARFPAAPREP